MMDHFLKGIKMQTSNIRDVAYSTLKQAIIEGKLLPGEKLVEKNLAELLNVSRTPLREAISTLEQEGWVTRVPSRGVKVSEISESDINNLFSVRAVLEGLCAFQATQYGTQEFIDDLEFVLTKMERASKQEDHTGVVEFGKQFHKCVIKASQNDYCLDILGKTMERIERFRHLGVRSKPGRGFEAVSEHKAIFEAIFARDSGKAEKLMKEHIYNSTEAIKFTQKNKKGSSK